MVFDARVRAPLTVLILSTVVLAGEARAQEAAAPAPAVPAPTPAEPVAPTPLPQLEVEATKKKSATKAPAKKAAQQPVSVPAPAPPPPIPEDPTGPGNANASDTSPYGPVKNYNAKNTETGIKTDTPLREIPQSISVVGAEQIRDMGAQTLQEALQYVPGVIADGYGLDSRSDGPFIRGTEASEYLDGLRRTSSYYSYNYRVDPYFMERIEVLRGPASVLYGQAPVGGIINSISKRPQRERGGEVTIEYGTYDFKQVKFDTTGLVTTDSKWSYRLTGVAREADTQVDYVGDDRYAIQPAISFRPDSNTSITVLGHFQKDDTGSTQQFLPHVGTIYPNVNGRRIPFDRFVGEPGDFYDTDVASGTVLAEHRFNSVFKLQHVSRYADIHNNYKSTFGGAYIDAAEEEMLRPTWRAITDTQIFNQDTNLEAKFATGILTHKVLGGLDYMNFRGAQASNSGQDINPFNVYNPQYGQAQWEQVNCADPSGLPVMVSEITVCPATHQDVAQTGLYVQDQMQLGNWIAVLGARKDWVSNETDFSSQKDDATSYRAGLMYEFASGFTPYVSYGESFVPVIGTTSPARGLAPFAPQRGRMYEVGFKYQPVGSNFAINSAIYDIAENNRLVPDIDPIYSVQIGAVSIKGFEIELTGQITENLKLVGGYSYTDAEYGDSTTIFDFTTLAPIPVGGNQIESVPKNLASMWGVWEFDQPMLKGWSVGAGVRYIGTSWDSTNTIEVPAVTLVDAMIAYETESWRWAINAKNLEDKEYVTTCLQRGDCFLGTARTIITGLTYKF